MPSVIEFLREKLLDEKWELMTREDFFRLLDEAERLPQRGAEDEVERLRAEMRRVQAAATEARLEAKVAESRYVEAWEKLKIWLHLRHGYQAALKTMDSLIPAEAEQPKRPPMLLAKIPMTDDWAWWTRGYLGGWTTERVHWHAKTIRFVDREASDPEALALYDADLKGGEM